MHRFHSTDESSDTAYILRSSLALCFRCGGGRRRCGSALVFALPNNKLPPPGSMEESQKRKRQLAAAADGGGEGKDRGRVTEDEAEEFFAILRRLQDAKSSLWSERHDIRDDGGGKKIARREVAEPRWRPRFVLEDFEGVAGGDDGVGSPSAVDDGKASCGGGTDLQTDLDAEPSRNRL